MKMEADTEANIRALKGEMIEDLNLVKLDRTNVHSKRYIVISKTCLGRVGLNHQNGIKNVQRSCLL